MYDTPHVHIDTSTRLPSFFETDRRRDGLEQGASRVKVERRAGERRTVASLRRG